jgi:hypothetical protein
MEHGLRLLKDHGGIENGSLAWHGHFTLSMENKKKITKKIKP